MKTFNLSTAAAAVALGIASSLSCAQEATNAGHTLYFWKDGIELDSRRVAEITQMRFQGVAFKVPNRSNVLRLQAWEVHSVDFATMPESVRVGIATVSVLASAPPSERLAALKEACSKIEGDLASIEDPFTKAAVQIEFARLQLQLAAIAGDSERAAEADKGLAALGEILADEGSWFFAPASEAAIDLYLVKDSTEEAMTAAKALVNAADAAGDPTKLLRVEARLLLTRAALASNAGASARDAAKETSEAAKAEMEFFAGKRDGAPIVKRLEILDRRAQIWQGYGVLLVNPKMAQGYFKSITDRVPKLPNARAQQPPNEPKRVLNADDYSQGLWPGSELWSGASLGRAEADYLVARDSRKKADIEKAIGGMLEALAVAPCDEEILARAKLRLGEALIDARGKGGEALAKSYFAEVAERHPTTTAAKVARTK